MSTTKPSSPAGPAVRVGRSVIHDRGLFAARTLRTGSVLERGPVLALPTGEPAPESLLLDYVFGLDDQRAGLLLGQASLCNHDEDPNAEVEIDHATLTFVLRALRPIRPGEEILIDYGPDYWA